MYKCFDGRCFGLEQYLQKTALTSQLSGEVISAPINIQSQHSIHKYKRKDKQSNILHPLNPSTYPPPLSPHSNPFPYSPIHLSTKSALAPPLQNDKLQQPRLLRPI